MTELVYVDADFSDFKPTAENKPKRQSPTVYARIDFGKVGSPQCDSSTQDDSPPPGSPIYEYLPPPIPSPYFSRVKRSVYDRTPEINNRPTPPLPERRRESYDPIAPPRNKRHPPPSETIAPSCSFPSLSPSGENSAGASTYQLGIDDPVKPDPVFESDNVYSLNKDNFHLFLSCKDVAMILFYRPEDMDKKLGLQTRYVKAANSTKRWNHGYATVNCDEEQELCNSLKVHKTPVFTIFSLTKKMGSFREATMDAENLRIFVENTPVLRV